MTSMEPPEYAAYRTFQFEEFMLTHKFVWDNALCVGRAIPFDRTAIQHGSSTTSTAPTISIQHGDEQPLPTIKPVQNLSLRGTSFQKYTLSPMSRRPPSPITPPSSTPSVFPCSSSTSSSPSPPFCPSSPSPASPLSPSANQDSVPPLFTTEFFEVLESPKKGYGAFALKDIEVGTVIISERPLFKAKMSEVYILHEQLAQEERREYATLWGWEGLNTNPIIARFMTNRFEINHSTAGIFLKSSRFNHACPEYKTCTYSYSKATGCLEVTAYRAIRKGEEITISYTNNPSTLYENYGFSCDCPGCLDSKREAKEFRWLRHDF